VWRWSHPAELAFLAGQHDRFARVRDREVEGYARAGRGLSKIIADIARESRTGELSPLRRTALISSQRRDLPQVSAEPLKDKEVRK